MTPDAEELKDKFLEGGRESRQNNWKKHTAEFAFAAVM